MPEPGRGRRPPGAGKASLVALCRGEAVPFANARGVGCALVVPGDHNEWGTNAQPWVLERPAEVYARWRRSSPKAVHSWQRARGRQAEAPARRPPSSLKAINSWLRILGRCAETPAR